MKLNTVGESMSQMIAQWEMIEEGFDRCPDPLPDGFLEADSPYEKFRRELWESLFPGEPLPEPYMGAVEDYAGCWGCWGRCLSKEISDDRLDEAIGCALKGEPEKTEPGPFDDTILTGDPFFDNFINSLNEEFEERSRDRGARRCLTISDLETKLLRDLREILRLSGSDKPADLYIRANPSGNWDGLVFPALSIEGGLIERGYSISSPERLVQVMYEDIQKDLERARMLWEAKHAD